MKKLCVICGKEFETNLAKKSCSPECKKKLWEYTRRIRRHKNEGEILRPKKLEILKPKKTKPQKPDEIKRNINRHTGNLETICWHCQNACGGCSWSKKLKPVKGWKAEKIKVKIVKGDYNDSYIVNECPEFKPDAKRKKKEV